MEATMVTQQGWLLRRWFFCSLWYSFLLRKSWNLWIFWKDCFQKCKHQFLAFFSLLKNWNRALKYLVSVLEKNSPFPFVVESGTFLFSGDPLSSSPGPFTNSQGPFLSSPDPFQNSGRAFFKTGRVFLCWMGALYKQKGPLTTNNPVSSYDDELGL